MRNIRRVGLQCYNPQLVIPSLQFQLRAGPGVIETEDHGRTQRAHLAVKYAETRRRLQAEQKLAQQKKRMEDVERDFEMACQVFMEDQQLLAQEAKLKRAMDEGFECIICTETWSVGMVSKVDRCAHPVCRECMVATVRAELDARRWPILCPLCRANPPTTGEPGGAYGIVHFHALNNCCSHQPRSV